MSTFLNVSRDSLETFPEHTMSGLALDYANLLSQFYESPKPFWYFSFLTCLGNLVSDMVVLDGGLKTQPRLYTLMLGSSGISHKSWAGEYTHKFFSDLFPDQFSVCTGLNSAEGLKNVLKDKPDTLLWFDELQTFVNKASIKTSTLLQSVNELYESNRSESNLAAAKLIIDPGYLSLLAACTKDTYEKVYTPDFLDIGFPNRLWIVPAERSHKIARPRDIPEDKLDFIRESLYSIYDFVVSNPKIYIDSIADAGYTEWYHSLPDSEYVNRLDGYALRLMLLYAISNKKTKVNIGMVNDVCELCNWQLIVRKLYAPFDADTQLAKLELKLIKRLELHDHTDREFKKIVKPEKYGFGVYNRALKNLVEARVIEKYKSGKTWKYCLI